LYLTASVTLPDEVPADGLDLGKYFDENRGYFWFVYTSYVALILTLITIRRWDEGFSVSQLWRASYFDYPSIPVGYALIFVRKRWVSGLALLVTLGWVLLGLNLWNRAPDLPGRGPQVHVQGK
jgi:hypothetical protein